MWTQIAVRRSRVTPCLSAWWRAAFCVLSGCSGAPFVADGAQGAPNVQDDASGGMDASTDVVGAGEGSTALEVGAGEEGAALEGGSEAEASCQVTHSNGVGQTWTDCVPLGTYSEAQARKACAAYLLAMHLPQAVCSDVCDSPTVAVGAGVLGQKSDAVWQYAGKCWYAGGYPQASCVGVVALQSCPDEPAGEPTHHWAAWY